MPPPRRTAPIRSPKREKSKVFIVHGHNHSLRDTVARFIERLGCKAIILHEQPNKGRSLLAKFASNAKVDFAVVLLTADDLGRSLASSKLHKRARQNVILELGFFLAAIGPEKVCPLYEEGVELPSDYDGVVYTAVDASEKWKAELAREMAAAGVKINSKQLLMP